LMIFLGRSIIFLIMEFINIRNQKFSHKKYVDRKIFTHNY